MKKVFWISIIVIALGFLSSCSRTSKSSQTSKTPLKDGQYFVYWGKDGSQYKYSVIKEGEAFRVNTVFYGKPRFESTLLVNPQGNIMIEYDAIKNKVIADQFRYCNKFFNSHIYLFGPPGLNGGDIYYKTIQVDGTKNWKDWKVYYLVLPQNRMYYYDVNTGFLVGMKLAKGLTETTEYILVATNVEGLLKQ